MMDLVALGTALISRGIRVARHIALVTANFGGIDIARILPSHPEIDAYYYTDQRNLGTVDGWNIQLPDYPRRDLHPRLQAKYFRCQMHKLEETRGYKWLVWGDSSLQFVSAAFLLQWADFLTQAPDRAIFFRHPHRKTVDEEYQHVIREMEKGNKYLLERYRDENMAGLMKHVNGQDPLIWTGLWMMENSPRYQALLDDWWDICLRYTIQDQLSLPHLLKKHGITAQHPGVAFPDPIGVYVGHLAHEEVNAR